jgi:hypothetical protein
MEIQRTHPKLRQSRLVAVSCESTTRCVEGAESSAQGSRLARLTNGATIRRAGGRCWRFSGPRRGSNNEVE